MHEVGKSSSGQEAKAKGQQQGGLPPLLLCCPKGCAYAAAACRSWHSPKGHEELQTSPGRSECPSCPQAGSAEVGMARASSPCGCCPKTLREVFTSLGTDSQVCLC